MGLFDRKKSTNSVSAMYAIRKLKSSGGSANLSRSQIVQNIIDIQDAKKYLSSDEYNAVNKLYQQFLTQTAVEAMDLDAFERVREVMAGQFDALAPYILFDGVNSKDLQLATQLKIRGMHSRGVPYEEALNMLKSDPGSIEPYKDYDPVGDPVSRRVATVMYREALAYYRAGVTGDKRDGNDILGFILGLYGILGKFLRKEEHEQEQNIIFNLIIFLATDGLADQHITKIMEKRKDLYIDCLKRFYKQDMEQPELIKALAGTASKFIETRDVKISGIEENLNSVYGQIKDAGE